MTDGRYSSIHMTDATLLALDLHDDDDGFGHIPAFDDVIPIPFDLDPPRPDDDETLPSKAHPSYPYGRPYQPTLNAFTSTSTSRSRFFLAASSAFHPHTSSSSGTSLWQDYGLRALLPFENAKEVPPGMAGAKRGPERDRSPGASSEAEGEDEDDEDPDEDEEDEGEEEEYDEAGSVSERETNGGGETGDETVANDSMIGRDDRGRRSVREHESGASGGEDDDRSAWSSAWSARSPSGGPI